MCSSYDYDAGTTGPGFDSMSLQVISFTGEQVQEGIETLQVVLTSDTISRRTPLKQHHYNDFRSTVLSM